MWLFLLAARHRMQALSALACSVGSGLKHCASLELHLFIHFLKEQVPWSQMRLQGTLIMVIM